MKKVNFKKIILTLIIIYCLYSFLGIIFGPIQKKENGNYKKGFPYGISIGWGDPNAE